MQTAEKFINYDGKKFNCMCYVCDLKVLRV